MSSYFDELSEHIARAQHRIILISAFIKSDTLSQLLSEANSDLPISIYARWRIEDIASGATDNAVIDIAKQHNASFKVLHSLHAKVFIVDDVALVGSANLTGSGLGIAQNPNTELMVVARADDARITDLLSILESKAVDPKPIPESALSAAKRLLLSTEDTTDQAPQDPWLPESDANEFERSILGGNWGGISEANVTKIINDYRAIDLGLYPDRELISERITNIPGIFQDIAQALETAPLIKEKDILDMTQRFFNNDSERTEYWQLLKKWLDIFMHDQVYILGGEKEDEIHKGKSHRD